MTELPDEIAAEYLAIFEGTVGGITNIVVKVDPQGNLSLVRRTFYIYWYFDYEAGEMKEARGEGSDLAAQVISQSGRQFHASAPTNMSEVSIDMIDYKLSPA